MMASPTTIHDFFVSEFACIAGNYFLDKPCRYYGRCDVKLFANISDIVIPDSFILCDTSKEDGQIIYGDPDLVLEVWSLRNSKYNTKDKTKMYKAASVKEIWEVYPGKQEIVVWYFDGVTNRYKDLRYNLFNAVESRIFPGLIIDYSLVKSKLDWSKSKYK